MGIFFLLLRCSLSVETNPNEWLKGSPRCSNFLNSGGYDTSQRTSVYDLVYMPFIVQILSICNPYRADPNLEQIHMHGTPHGVDNLPKTGPLYLPPSLSLIFSKWDPLGVILGRAPMRVGRAWGGVSHAPCGLVSHPRSDMGPGRVRVSRVAYMSCRLPCNPIPTRIRKDTCKFTVCTI